MASPEKRLPPSREIMLTRTPAVCDSAEPETTWYTMSWNEPWL